MESLDNNKKKSQEVRPRLAGIGLTLVLTFWGVKPLFDGEPVRSGLLIGAGIILSLALFAPELLRPLASVMHTLAGWLTRGLSWLALSLAFWFIMTPAALAMKLFRRDLLKLHFDPQVKSYWVTREECQATLEELRRQF